MNEIREIVEEMNKQHVIVDDIRFQVSENKVNRCLEANMFYLLSDCFGFPVQNVGTETGKIGTPNARIFAWAENDNVEMEIIVKRKGH